MATYVNVGAQSVANGIRYASKKALREALKKDASVVAFDSTSSMGPYAGETLYGDDLPYGVTLSVVGPDPYTSRKWYANVERRADGKVVVS